MLRALLFLIAGLVAALVVSAVAALIVPVNPAGATLDREEVRSIWLDRGVVPSEGAFLHGDRWSNGVCSVTSVHCDFFSFESRQRVRAALTVHESGWPMGCLTGSAVWRRGAAWQAEGLYDVARAAAPANPRRLPIRPVYAALLVDAVALAAPIWLIIASTRATRRRVRVHRRRCPKCGYQAGVSDVCTECGSGLGRERRNGS